MSLVGVRSSPPSHHSESAQSLSYALRVLRHHGMTEAGVTPACMPSSAQSSCHSWHIRVTSMERIHYRDRPPTSWCVSASKQASARLTCRNSISCWRRLSGSDDELLNKIKNNPNHTLHQFLPAQSIMATQHYHLRHRAHDRQLPAHQGHLLDCNMFITRLLYKKI